MNGQLDFAYQWLVQRYLQVQRYTDAAALLRQQPLRHVGGRGGRPEEARAHVVLDPDHAVTGGGEVANGLGADQASSPCDDDCAHVMIHLPNGRLCLRLRS